MKEGKRLGIYRAKKPHAAEEIKTDAEKRLSLINKEFATGLELVLKYTRSVTFFGSSILTEDNSYYIKARELAAKVSSIGYAVVTGGGPGIMEAANRGAYEAGGTSIGLNIELPSEQKQNPYLTDYAQFHYFFSRKVALAFAAEAYVFFPGGYGTLNEFFEIVMLIQTQRIKPVPVLLYGSEFWKPLEEFIRLRLFGEHHTVEERDLSIFRISDDQEAIIETIRSAPIIPDIPFTGSK